VDRRATSVLHRSRAGRLIWRLGVRVGHVLPVNHGYDGTGTDWVIPALISANARHQGRRVGRAWFHTAEVADAWTVSMPAT